MRETGGEVKLNRHIAKAPIARPQRGRRCQARRGEQVRVDIADAATVKPMLLD